MPTKTKRDFPVANIRRFLEPGPVILVTSAWRGKRNVMTMGWHLVMEFVPSTVGIMLSTGAWSHELVRRSRECVLNLPTVDMLDTVVRIGNCSGRDGDKFDSLGLTAAKADRVGAPLIDECHASFECRVVDTRLVRAYSFFVLEVVKAHARPTPKNPPTIHYRGDGQFMVAGRNVSRRRLFRPDMLR